MIDDLLLGLGLVAIVEGLVLALAPSHLARGARAASRAWTPSGGGCSGSLAVAAGVGLVWLARA